MRAAAWTASVAAVVGIALVWSALRVIGLYALWTIGDRAAVLLAAGFGMRALLLAATAVCVAVGVARRAARGSGRGALVAAIVLAGVVVAAQVFGVLVVGHFRWESLLNPTAVGWLVFAALTIVAASLALSSARPTALSTRGEPGDPAPDARPSARAAVPYAWFAVTAAFLAFVAAVLVVAQVFIVPNAWGPALVALAQAVVALVAVAVQMIGALYVVRGSALGRVVVSAAAVILLVDSAESAWLYGGIAGAATGGTYAIGAAVATVLAVAAAVALWLPPVSRYLGEAGGVPDDATTGPATEQTRPAPAAPGEPRPTD